MTRDEYLRTVFLERIAHDARGAAGVSIGALEELEAALESGEELQPLLLIAGRGMRRLLRLAESLADAAELERGGVALLREPVDLAALATQAAEQARGLENRRAIAMELRCEPVTASVDRARIVRAIFELTSNAIRCARAQVLIETRAVEGGALIQISDDGSGCGQPTPRFTPSAERRGLGLGLPLASELTLLHGGELSIAREDEHTVVRMKLPSIAA